MFNHATRDSFRIDLLIPTIQTTTAFITTEILGRLGHYTLKSQTTILVASVASIVSSFVSNFFKKPYLYYAALPFGIGAGLATHTFFYPSTSITLVLDAKGILILIGVLAAVKFIADNLPYIRQKEEELEEDLHERVQRLEDKVLVGTGKVLDKVEENIGKLEDKIEKVKATIKKKKAEPEKPAI
jgi:hypothetical protein